MKNGIWLASLGAVLILTPATAMARNRGGHHGGGYRGHTVVTLAIGGGYSGYRSYGGPGYGYSPSYRGGYRNGGYGYSSGHGGRHGNGGYGYSSGHGGGHGNGGYGYSSGHGGGHGNSGSHNSGGHY